MKNYLLQLIILFSTSLYSQTPKTDPYFTPTKDTVALHGPQNITRSVLQDKKGNMWFSSWEGIISYNGKTFTNYTLKYNLIKFHMFSVFEDSKGNLWFGSVGAGVYKYDGKSFRLYNEDSGLSNDMVLCITEDKAGNIWFGTDNGVSKYNPEQNGAGGKSFVNFNLKDGLGGASINSILQDKSGRIWFATRFASGSDVSYYDPSAPLSAGVKPFTVFKNKEGIAFANARSIIQDKNGNIWIGSQNGLFMYNPQALLTGVGKSVIQLSTNFIGYLFEDSKGNLWTSEGVPNIRTKDWNQSDGMALCKYNIKSLLTEGIKSGTKIKHERQVFGITEDKTGNIWFCTEMGVEMYNPVTKSIKVFSK